jgi:transposase InsO family protein
VHAAFAEAGHRQITATVDGGPEFQREFRATYTQLGIRRYQLPARSPTLNAFAERFQGTCLHAPYRVAFRYRYYQHADDVDADLQAWLGYHNYQRPHRGYRTQGRLPAAIFYATRPDLLTAKGWNPNDVYPAA